MAHNGALLIRGGHVVDPASRVDGAWDLLLRDGVVAEVAKTIKANGATVIDAAGGLVLPGLIDLHTHARQPGQEDKETIATACAAAAKGGFTAICTMPNTDPVADTRGIIEFIKAEAERLGGVRVYPIAAVTRGLRGEELCDFGELADAGAIAFSDDGGPVANSEVLRRALEYTKMLPRAIIDHCEEPTLSEGGAMHEGFISTVLGLRGIPEAAETVAVLRDLHLAKLTGGRLHLAHLSTATSVEAVRQAKRQGVAVTCEACPHHFALTDEAVRERGAYAKMNPPLRTPEDVAAIIAGLADGTIDLIATDHAPHTSWEKLIEFEAAPFGVIGLETALSVAIDRLARPGHLSWSALVERMSAAPAKAFGLPGGSLRVGAAADVTLVDPDATWTVREEAFVSKSRNSPFIGATLPGVVSHTIVRGRVIYARGVSASPARP